MQADSWLKELHSERQQTLLAARQVLKLQRYREAVRLEQELDQVPQSWFWENRYVDLSSTTQPRRTVVPAHKILWDEYDRRKVCISPRMLHASLTSCKLIAKPCRWQCMEKSFAAPLSLANIPWPPDISEDCQHEVWSAATRELLRKELLRWHPDKFLQKFGSRLAAEEKKLIIDKVQRISERISSEWRDQSMQQ